jgi:hypothetical protein
MSQIRKESSPLTDVMEYYDAEMTRDEYVLANLVGEVAQDSFIPVDVEATFPAQFRRRTLSETRPASDKVQ